MTPERDHASNLSPVQIIDTGVLSADSAAASIDLLGFASAVIALSIGVGGITFTGANKIEFKLTHSDDNAAYSDVTDTDLVKDQLFPTVVAGGIVRSLTAAHAAPTVQKLGYVGGKRYLKLLADFSGTHGAGTPISAVCLRGDAQIRGAA